MKRVTLFYSHSTTSFRNVAELIAKYLNRNGIVPGAIDYNYIPSGENLGTVLNITSLTWDTVSCWYRFMFWCDKYVFYGVLEGKPIFSYFSHYALGRSTVIVPSQYVKMKLEGEGVRVDGVVPHGIDTSDWNRVDPAKVAYFRNLFKDRKVLLMVSHRGIRKGFEYLMKAFERIAKKRNDVVLVLHTEDDARKAIYMWDREPPFGMYSLSEYARKNGFESKVWITNQAGSWDFETLKALYHSCDIYVHSALSEGFSLTIAEALACGKPVIAINAMPMNEHVKDGYNGLLVRYGEVKEIPIINVMRFELKIPDLDDLSSKMEELIDNDELRKEMSVNAKISAMKYDYMRTYSQLMRYL